MTNEPGPNELLSWYDNFGRDLPWRSKGNSKPNPYHVWLSEVMLQQTTVAVVLPYFQRFLYRWPSIEDLSRADLNDVLQMWAGLGYYARARNLHSCAKFLVEKYHGQFPQSEKELMSLPGIGLYTASAILSIAFGISAVVVDGNVERVISRLFKVKDPPLKSKVLIRELASKLTPKYRSGDYAQAIMDLGSTVCKPKSPLCNLCPWQDACEANITDCVNDFPRKIVKARKPNKSGICFWLTRPDGTVLLRRRKLEGLLGGMMEIPSTPWEDRRWCLRDAINFFPLSVSSNSWKSVKGSILHPFSHFNLRLEIRVAELINSNDLVTDKDIVWADIDKLDSYALPSVMVKVANHVIQNFSN